jgi:hypothetical protein
MAKWHIFLQRWSYSLGYINSYPAIHTRNFNGYHNPDTRQVSLPASALAHVLILPNIDAINKDRTPKRLL